MSPVAYFNLQSPPAAKPVKLRNLTTGDQTVDTLHNKYKQNAKSSGCTGARCLGALMNPKPVEHKVRSVGEILEHAKDFIDNYYQSIKRLGSPAHKNRLAEIEEELRTTETYYLKETELTYGAKLAWRNAARCIGRIQWSKLQLFDARFTSNANEMFEALCNHIKYATNKGSLRSAITILPQRVKSTDADWRIWNSQLIGYAGYRSKEEPHRVVGDPANADLTEICQKLGWKGKGGRFDVLPLVLSANGGPPQMFELPEDIVMRVKIRHPKYKWFEELGLEWYALPAVANMMLDVGGLQFTAAPFSGWYMVTEIGTRDLGDAARYNVLEEVAQRMGLNTTSNMSLWKDQAVVELNIAVLDSFQSAGVTMVDHHTASETFMTHLANEQRLRGGCPADWVWLVPPTSGSTTQIFHQELVNYHLLPAYEYMEPVWKNYDWARWERLRQEEELAKEAAGKRRSSSMLVNGLTSKLPAGLPLSPSARSANGGELTPRKRGFREIARAVKFTSKLFGKALSRRIKATILYATETGKSERFANRLAQTFSHAFNVHLMSMIDYDMTCLEHEALLLIVTSTFGNGDPPESGELFAKHLAAVKITGDTSPDIDSINSVSTNPFFQMLSEDHKDGLASAAASLDPEQRDAHSVAAGKQQVQSKQEQQTNIKPLSNVRFGVFALGSTAYPHYCAFGRYVDQTLGELGAERILKCTCGDELCGQEKAFTGWSNDVFRTACDVFCLTDSIGPIDHCPEVIWSPKDVRLVPVELLEEAAAEETSSAQQEQQVSRMAGLLSSKKTIVRNLMSTTNKKIVPFTVKSRTYLHKYLPEENLQTFCIELESELISAVGSQHQQHQPVAGNQLVHQLSNAAGNKSSVTSFEAGDHVALYPLNKADMVERIIERMRADIQDKDSPAGPQARRFNFDQALTILVKRENMDLTPAMAPAHTGAEQGANGAAENNNWITYDRLPVTSIREALTRYLDITSTANQEFLLILSRQASDPDERKRLQLMARNSTIYEEWKYRKVPTLVSLLDEFKTIKFEPALITQLPLMKPRFYSVSGTSTSLTVGVVRFKTAEGELREGVCSNYLNTVPTGLKEPYIFGYIRSAPAFHMPADKSTPLILISAGTGIAPFRSFWMQRHADLQRAAKSPGGAKFGCIELYFGCRNSNYILYKDELDEMYQNGVLSSINIAFSRPLDSDVAAPETGSSIASDYSDLATGATSEIAATATKTGNSKVSSIRQARKKMYVQDRLLEDSDNIYRLIMLGGAHVYVCGDVAMADGVYKTLTSIFNNYKMQPESNLKLAAGSPSQATTADSGLGGIELAKSPDDGESILMNMRNLNRYHEDIFGAKQAS